MKWSRKDLLSISELSPEEVTVILDTAKSFRAVLDRRVRTVPALRGRTVVNLFVEPSTRTRVSFEMAEMRLSANVINLASESSSFKKGETLKDTARTLEALSADFIVIRHSAAGASQFLAERLESCIINAGDGAHSHPTQALLDVFTLRERLGDLKGKKVLILGDILFSRVARSNIWALTKLGADVTLAGPATLVPKVFERMGVRVVHKLDDIIGEMDAINLLRIQHERQHSIMFPSVGEYVAIFGLTKQRFAECKKDVVIMHPGPINRGVEIDSELADSENSVILDQVTNGMAVRMAVLYLCSGSSELQTEQNS